MTEQSQEGNFSQDKPRRNKEVLKHVHLERSRPKLSSYDEQDNARKAKKAQTRRTRAQSASRGKKQLTTQPVEMLVQNCALSR